jgi:hypothetical protein
MEPFSEPSRERIEAEAHYEKMRQAAERGWEETTQWVSEIRSEGLGPSEEEGAMEHDEASVTT